ncbi:hypothetical protein O988_07176 [Pseudogymnoascus sp. VKM F-3808]|nr:hypothetical protein O988_07176 [Pseudogymnoascus sp. VKM F-3808]
MSDVAASSSAAAPRASSGSLKANYLLAYNAISMFSWLSLLWHAGLVVRVWGLEYVHQHVDLFWKVTQSLAALEVLHSIFGIVRSPFMTTLMQVASRFLICWGTVNFFPEVAKSPVFSTLLVAHGVTEVIRYGYFAMALSGEQVAILGWLRYNTFIVLYPLGIASVGAVGLLLLCDAGHLRPGDLRALLVHDEAEAEGYEGQGRGEEEPVRWRGKSTQRDRGVETDMG